MDGWKGGWVISVVLLLHGMRMLCLLMAVHLVSSLEGGGVPFNGSGSRSVCFRADDVGICTEHDAPFNTQSDIVSLLTPRGIAPSDID